MSGVAPGGLRIGVIAGPHGLRGAVRMRPDNPDSNALIPGMRVRLEAPAGRPGQPIADHRIDEHRIVEIAPLGHGTLKLTLTDINDADASAALKGRIVTIDAADLPAAKPGEFYYFQALGCAVVTADGQALGTVVEIFQTGANDVMVVRDGAREILVPVIADVVRAVDLEKRRVTIDPIPGLLD
ncbi:MAG TPA: ribosome maturation factor RimM [Candidatus Binataceae bacterium]|nr:ribosome maturation factor RimM [Candidatus Binataceae bacterium]